MQDFAHAVADFRSGGQRQVDDAEGHAQAGGHLAADQFADAGDAEGGRFDLFGDVVEGALGERLMQPLEGPFDDARDR